MSRKRLFAAFFCCAFLFPAFNGTEGAIAQSRSGEGRSVLSNLLHSSKPYTVQEEIELANYLEGKTLPYLASLEKLDMEKLQEQVPQLDEDAAELLELKIDNLKVSLKEMIETLRLVDRLVKERPADYAKAAPLLWLTVVKDISTETEDSRDLERLNLVKSDWANITAMVLPRLFSRILEPRLTAVLRDQTNN